MNGWVLTEPSEGYVADSKGKASVVGQRHGRTREFGKVLSFRGAKVCDKAARAGGGEVQRLGTCQYRLFIQAMPSRRNRCPGTGDQGKAVMATKVSACGYLLKLNSGF